LRKKQKDKYAVFWIAFSKVLKEGSIDDSANREELAKLVRFAITAAAPEHGTSRSLRGADQREPGRELLRDHEYVRRRRPQPTSRDPVAQS
jgi:HSP90 family molecular chaperone